MKIIVCVKVSKGEINHFDKSALECALQMSDDVTVVSMGPVNCESVLKPLTRLGAKVVLLSDSVYAGSDTLATSYVLSTAIKNMQYDLILCGRQSIDGDTAQVGPMLSYMLGCSLITNAILDMLNRAITKSIVKLEIPKDRSPNKVSSTLPNTTNETKMTTPSMARSNLPIGTVGNFFCTILPKISVPPVEAFATKLIPIPIP